MVQTAARDILVRVHGLQREKAATLIQTQLGQHVRDCPQPNWVWVRKVAFK